MAIVINGSTGISATESSSVLGDGVVESADIADSAVTAGKLASTLDLTGKTVTLPAGTGGKLLQVASTNFTTQYSTSTAQTYINTASLAVTPQGSNSKFIIQADGHLYHGVSTGRGRFGFSVTQGGTTTRLAGVDSSSGDSWAMAYPGVAQSRIITWDSSAPAGTEITFNLLIAMFDAGTLYLNYSGYGHKTFFIVTEVAA